LKSLSVGSDVHESDGQTIESDSDLARYLIDRGHVVTILGNYFRRSRHLRVAFAVPLDTIDQGIS